MNIDERLAAAIQREIDGESTESESAELRATLATNREAADLFTKLEKLRDALAADAPVDPPMVGEQKQMSETDMFRGIANIH